MKNHFLFPSWFKALGLLLAIPGILLGALFTIWDYSFSFLVIQPSQQDSASTLSRALNGQDLSNELAVFLTVLGLLFLGFAKQFREDELVARMRLNALQWGVYIYLIFYLASLVISEEMIEFFRISEYRSELNIILPLLFFNLRFYYLFKMKADVFELGDLKLFPYSPYLVSGRVMGVIGFGLCMIFFYYYINGPWFSSESEVKWYEEPIYSRISFLIMMLGLFWWSFSKRKYEDEGTTQLRLNALQIAFYTHYILILVGTATIFSLSYLLFLTIVQGTLLVFNVIFLEVFLLRQKMSLKKEERLSYEK